LVRRGRPGLILRRAIQDIEIIRGFQALLLLLDSVEELGSSDACKVKVCKRSLKGINVDNDK